MIRNTYIFIILMLYSMAGYAIEYNCRYITNRDGLSNSSITTIYQDSSSLMWFGTWDGLNMFDGHSFYNYQYASDNTNSINNNVIRDIVEQRKGLLWIVTDHGISRFDVVRSKFTRYYLGYEYSNPKQEKTYKIAYAQSGTIFCSAKEWGLAYYDSSIDDFVPLNITQCSTYDIEGLIDIGKEKLLLKKSDGSSYVMKYKQESANKIKVTEVVPHNLPPETQDIKKDLPAGFPSKENITCILKGSQGIIWAGTDGQGVIMLYPVVTNFNKLLNKELGNEKNSPIRTFFEDDKSNIWLGTKGNGIKILNRNTRNITSLDKKDGLNNSAVYTIKQGFGNDILIGTDGIGLNVFSAKNGKISELDVTEIRPKNAVFGSVYSAFLDKADSILWLGTSGYGLIRLKIKVDSQGIYRAISARTYTYEHNDKNSISNNIIFSIVPNGDNQLLIATRGGGVNVYNKSKNTFTRYQTDANNPQSISSNDVLSIHKSRAGNIWIGTSYGLNKMSITENGTEFMRVTQNLNMPSNTIHGVLEDNMGNLWASTNKGISKIKYDDKGSPIAVNYYANEQLQSDEFADGAYFIDTKGVFYFGGIAGINFFLPESVVERQHHAEIYMKNLMVNEHDRISEIYSGKRRITLKHGENSFSTSFVALDYINNNNCEYKYILEGFNKNWINIGTSNNILFTNIPSGKYTFRLRSTNSDKLWCDNEYYFEIRIKYPWWGRWWAYLLYILLLTWILYVIYSFIKKRMDLNKTLFLERLNKHNQQKIYEAKLRFFTNITHEFCTPLTLIYGPCEKLLEKAGIDQKDAKYIHIIKSNANRMQRLITELMEFRKIETDHRSVSMSHVDIDELISCVVDNFVELGEEHKIELNYEPFAGGIIWVTDRDSAEKIIYNLVSNAYKYTPQAGRIDVKTLKQDDRLVIQVTNTGKGIPTGELNSVFDRFKILDNFESKASRGDVLRTGIGLAITQGLTSLLGGEIKVESTQNECTTFTVYLPMGDLQGEDMQIEDTEKAYGLIPHLYEQENHKQDSSIIKLKVLIVDDEKEIRMFVADILSDEYDVSEAVDGEDALKMIKRGMPDIIICDVAMPNKDGISLVKDLKDNYLTNHIPIVFLTSKLGIDDKISAYETGADRYITKPFQPKYLKAVLRQIILSHNQLKHYFTSAISSGDMFEGNFVTDDDKEFIVKLTMLIENNIQNEDINIMFLCNELGISRMQLFRKIKEVVGASPSEYIRLIRLKHAAHLLKSTSMTVQEIMFAVGFNNKSYFYREFSKKYNVSPKEYRETIQ